MQGKYWIAMMLAATLLAASWSPGSGKPLWSDSLAGILGGSSLAAAIPASPGLLCWPKVEISQADNPSVPSLSGFSGSALLAAFGDNFGFFSAWSKN